eukprot:scaffold93_cov233-Pinguiococcus_pyrenoidosus.AAC.2
MVPVSQKAQPLAQPTCEDTHTVTERAPWPMSTASTTWPLRSWMATLALASSRAGCGLSSTLIFPSSSGGGSCSPWDC